MCSKKMKQEEKLLLPNFKVETPIDHNTRGDARPIPPLRTSHHRSQCTKTPSQLRHLRIAARFDTSADHDLTARVRPHAVKLVDAFTLPDYLLDSALGREDGRVYEALFHRTRVLNPSNRKTFNPHYWENQIVMGSGNGGDGILAKLRGPVSACHHDACVVHSTFVYCRGFRELLDSTRTAAAQISVVTSISRASPELQFEACLAIQAVRPRSRPE